MKFVLLLVFFSLIGSSFLFYFSDHLGGNSKNISTKSLPVPKIIKNNDKVISQKIVKPIKPIRVQKDIAKVNKIVAQKVKLSNKEQKPHNFKKNPNPSHNVEKVKNIKDIKKQDKKIKDIITPSKKFKNIKKEVIATPMGTYEVTTNLKAISPSQYKSHMGKIQAKGRGYYFIEKKEGRNSTFPLLVNKVKREKLSLLTGLITIKTRNSENAERIKKKYSLSLIQKFPHIHLYIYQLKSPQKIGQTFTKIKNEPGVLRVELEILDKKLRKL